MKVKDSITWKTRKGWNTKGHIVEINGDKIRVEALDISFKAPIRNGNKSYTRPKYWINAAQIIEINGAATSDEKES